MLNEKKNLKESLLPIKRDQNTQRIRKNGFVVVVVVVFNYTTQINVQTFEEDVFFKQTNIQITITMITREIFLRNKKGLFKS